MSSHRVNIDGREVRLTNLDKVLYPAAGFTKAQVIDYYSRIAQVMLPHLRDRPISLRRFPNGVDGHRFFEKNCPSHRPEWVKTVTLPSSGGKRETITFCMVNDRPTLVWLANLAALELHAYLHLADAPEHPTLLVFDLDPGQGATFGQCVRIALALRDLLHQYSLKCWAKTSGGKGLHVYVPLNAAATTYEQTKTLARAVAATMVKKHPHHAIDTMSKAARRGKVFIDWSQNSSHKTTVAVYSLRGRDVPSVSMPVDWNEVEQWTRRQVPPSFRTDEALSRMAQVGDLFESVLRMKQALPVHAMSGA